MADDDRLKAIRKKLRARRDAAAATKREEAARQAIASERSVMAATCWPSQQAMMHSVVDAVNASFDQADPKLDLNFSPHGSGWLGRGEVKFGGQPIGMSFAVAPTGKAQATYHDAQGRAVTPAIDLTADQWRAMLYDYMDAQL